MIVNLNKLLFYAFKDTNYLSNRIVIIDRYEIYKNNKNYMKKFRALSDGLSEISSNYCFDYCLF